jgi:hypothetical protein
MEMSEANAVRLKQFGSVKWSLASASPIRLSGRGMRYPAERRRSRAAYQRDRTDRPHARKRASGPAAHPAPRYAVDTRNRIDRGQDEQEV